MMALRIPAFVMMTALVAIAAPAAQAQDDPRLVTHAYDPANIVKIQGRLGVQATIVFGEDEKIENVAVGDSQKWQITPNKRANLLFAKPLEAAASTNMTVVTDKRTYLFDLVATIKDRPVYMLRFTYGQGEPPPAVAAAPPEAAPAVSLRAPVEDVAPVLAAAPPEAAPAVPVRAPAEVVANVETASPIEAQLPALAEDAAVAALPPPPASPAVSEMTAVDEAIAASVVSATTLPSQPLSPVSAWGPNRENAAVSEPGALNFAWTSTGERALLPRRVYDDGRATFLVWGAKQTVPGVFAIDDAGQEAPVGMQSEGNSVVIPLVPARIVLRNAKASAALENLRRARLTALADESN